MQFPVLSAVLHACALLAFTILSSSAAADEPVSPELQEKIIAGCQAEFRGIASLSFAATIHTDYARPYLASNPDKARFDNLTTLLQGVLTDARFRVVSTLLFANGTHPPDNIQTYDGRQFNLFFANPTPSLIIEHSFPLDSGNISFPFGTMALLPYSFLYVPSDDYFVPNLSLARTTNRAAWTEFFQRARVLDTNTRAGLLRLRFQSLGGTIYIVTFSTDDGYYPIAFEKSNPSGLAQRYGVDAFATARKGDVQFRYPRKAHFESFINSWPRQTISVEMTDLEVNADTHAVEFTINPGTAVNVYDEGKEKAE